MKFALCEELGIDFPLFAFSHCRDVVAEVSRAGGFGVLGAAGHTPESLEIELAWIDEHVDGKPYGVDLIVPTSMDDKEGNFTPAEVEARIPPEHKAYVERILAENGVSVDGLWSRGVSEGFASGMREKGAAAILDVAFAHPIKLIVNALGVPPQIMLDRAREAGVKVARSIARLAKPALVMPGNNDVQFQPAIAAEFLQHANEEMFVILEGEGTLRYEGRTYPVRPGDVIAAPTGKAHQLLNTSTAELRYLAISTMIEPEISEYPDSNKRGMMAGSPPGRRPYPLFVAVPIDAEVEYWEGEE